MSNSNKINVNYNDYNWWQLELDELPTKGLFYPPNTVIKTRSMSVLEVKLLATLIPETATVTCNEIINKCVYTEGIEISDLLLPDREYIVFWIRLNSFTASSGYEIKINQCQYCKSEFSKKISLLDFPIDYLSYFNPDVHLEDLDVDIKIKIPEFKDSTVNVKDDIGVMCLWLDCNNTFQDRYNFIASLTALDFITLKNHIDQNKCGVSHLLNIECPHCQGVNKINMILNDESIFGAVKLDDVLETITRIAKYANLQIDNKWSWPEVEAEQLVINKMVEEENEANQKEISKAKAQASSINTSIPHHSIPSIR